VDRTISEEELLANNGEDGKPIYIAKDGIVYDVSASKMWRGGQHMRRHSAGRDLSADFGAAPHDESVLERYPRVGALAQKETEERLPFLVELLLEKGPRPHPLSVHFPVAYVAATAILVLLYLVTGVEALETVSYYILWIGVLSSPLAIGLGALTWWYNYGHKLTRFFQIKIGVSLLLMGLGGAALLLRALNPDIVIRGTPEGSIYIGLLLLMVLCVAALGWVGDEITFPRKREGNGYLRLLKRMIVPVGALLVLGLAILMLSYEIVGVEFAGFMEDQPSAGAQDAPRIVPPADAIPFDRPAYLDDPTHMVNPVPADSVSLQRGAVLFSLNCAVCHGAGGRGDGPVTAFWQGGQRRPPDLTQDYIDGLADAVIYGIIHDGLGGMPPLRENLDERERWDVVNYVRSLRP
jgi:predicted heme/steroid binding protein/mono/diheme cytochrome c family protein/uncharacterized membrane protein